MPSSCDTNALNRRQIDACPQSIDPNPTDETTGLPEWTEQDRSLVDEALVVWYTQGLDHVPRAEGWPILPVAIASFHLKPDGCFDRNPSVTLLAEPCHTGYDLTSASDDRVDRPGTQVPLRVGLEGVPDPLEDAVEAPVGLPFLARQLITDLVRTPLERDRDGLSSPMNGRRVGRVVARSSAETAGLPSAARRVRTATMAVAAVAAGKLARSSVSL